MIIQNNNHITVNRKLWLVHILHFDGHYSQIKHYNKEDYDQDANSLESFGCVNLGGFFIKLK